MGRFENPPYYITAYGLAVKRGYKGTLDEWLLSLSAFGIAKQNGFEGTADEWLTSLSAYGIARENGFEGTADEWLISLSAYGVARAEGFDGSVSEWLDSLKGEKGDTGKSAYEYALEAGFEGSEELFREKQGQSGKSAYEYAVEGGYQGSVEDFVEKLATEFLPKTDVDRSLSKEGQAADAKATGDKIAAIEGIAEDHEANTGNPHNVTAEQVGARANTWLPSLSDIGAAPSGYGYGGAAVNLGAIDSDEAFNTAVETVYSKLPTNGTALIRWLENEHSQFAMVTRSSANYGSVVAHSTWRKGVKRTKTKTNGAWGPWEWDVAPMALGVEYRTTKRHNGHPVFTKTIDGGSLVNAADKKVYPGISDAYEFVSCSARCGLTSGSTRLNLLPTTGSSDGKRTYIKQPGLSTTIITCEGDMSAQSVQVCYEYTKNV